MRVSLDNVSKLDKFDKKKTTKETKHFPTLILNHAEALFLVLQLHFNSTSCVDSLARGHGFATKSPPALTAP